MLVSGKGDFLEYVAVLDSASCWLWLGGKDPKGYGYVNLSRVGGIGAHRAAYILLKGEIPPKMYVCHRCDNPSCVNPDHLFLGTHKDNVLDCVKKGRNYAGGRNYKHGGKRLTEVKIINGVRHWVEHKSDAP